MKILIVDDNPTNRKLLRVTLEAEGFSTLEAADGVEALAALERQPVDAIVSDILMPRMDGFRLCQEIRKHQRFGHLPFLIYSATYTSPGDEKLALNCGADRYLRKPCPVPVMAAAIQEVAAEAQQRRATRPRPLQELQVMREYNEALVQKLEERSAAIEQQREWLRVTLTSIGDAVIAADTAGRITFLNPVAETLTGWPENEAMGQPVQGVFRTINERTHEPAAAIAERVLREGSVIAPANHTALVARDGREIPIEGSAALIRDSAGQVSGVVLVFHDVTEKRRAQEALRESEERFRTVANFTYDWEYWRSPEGRFLFVSPSCECLSGYTAEEFIRDPDLYLRIVHPEDRDRVRAHLREDLTHAAPCRLEFRLVRRDGQERWIGHACHPVVDAQGRLSGRRGSNRDITEWKAAEEGLRDSRRAALNLMEDALAARQRAEQAGVELRQEITERKRAEETIKASLHEKEVLLKEIHHRVKNNLQVISSLVRLQADSLADPTLRDRFRDVHDRVRSMALVHEKLYESANLAQVQFADYARSLLAYLWRAHGAAAASIRLALELEPVPLSVETAVPCGLILNELAGNALKHAFAGRTEGEVTVALRSGPDGQARLAVGDDGVGLPPGMDWRQARSLGLQLVQMLAGQLGATVEVRSGPGTAFEICFTPPAFPGDAGGGPS